MLKPIIIIIIIFALIYGVYHYVNTPQITDIGSSKINVNRDPVQSQVVDPKPIIYRENSLNLEIYPLYKYVINANLVSKKKYVSGWSSKISPYDFALAWGKVAHPGNLLRLKFRQTLRWYTYRYDNDLELSPQYITYHTSNNHMIPATDNIKKAISSVKEGDLVRITGYLVNVSGSYKDKGVKWSTSQSREDNGDGACEIIYVTEIKIGSNIYR